MGAPLNAIFDGVRNILDKFVSSPQEKLQAHIMLVSQERQFQLEMAKLDQDWAETQASVIKSEAESTSFLARSWRPILMLVFTYIVAHNYVVAPLFSVASVPIPPDMWDLLKLGMGGYIIGRSAEKVAPAIAEIATKNKR